MKNVMLYAVDLTGFDEARMRSALENLPFAHCDKLQDRSGGFIPAGPSESLLHAVDGVWTMQLREERRKVPPAVLRERLAEKIAERKRQGEEVKGRLKRELKEEAYYALLAEVIPQSTYQRAVIDTRTSRLAIEASSPKKAEDFLVSLNSALAGEAHIAPLRFRNDIAESMSNWVRNDDVPEGIVLGDTCVVADRDGGGRITYRKQELADDERLREYLSQHRVLEQLEIVQGANLRLTLTHKGVLKGLKALDGYDEARAENEGLSDEATAFDVDLVLFAAALREVIEVLTPAFGGFEE